MVRKKPAPKDPEMPVITDMVVVMKLVDGDTIITVVNRDFDHSDVYFLFDPQLFITMNTNGGTNNPEDFCYEFEEWLVGAKESVHPIPYYNVVVWYEVNGQIAKDYYEFTHPDEYSDDTGTITAHEYLKSKNTVH